jgi:hypothetical protein
LIVENKLEGIFRKGVFLFSIVLNVLIFNVFIKVPKDKKMVRKKLEEE